jgi:hypothetical protein
VVVLAERGLTAVALTNLANAPASQLACGAINAYLSLAPETPWDSYPEYDPDTRALGRFAGTYQGQPGTTARVSVRDDTLYVDMGDGPKRARPYAERCFLVEESGEALAFLENEAGNIWAMAPGLRTFPKVG